MSHPSISKAEALALPAGAWKPLTVYGARKLAREFGVRLPRAGYEMCLGSRLYLVNRLHPQFGTFELTGSHVYELRHY